MQARGLCSNSREILLESPIDEKSLVCGIRCIFDRSDERLDHRRQIDLDAEEPDFI
jgi:hypothetical protein